ncbi:MAG TPA: ATP phosphoribosyltransferase, partial [Pseudodesulfovibrio sp.]|nr:ATP phosphoribosyltransferase [Pseudodesulfovibrio sp.]
GSSLRANNMRIVETILETNTKFIANTESWEQPEKRRKIEQIGMLLEGAIRGEDKVGLMMNVPRSNLPAVLEVLPSMNTPTVSPMTDEAWVDVLVILEERVARDLIPELKRQGAQGIVEFPLNKVIP